MSESPQAPQSPNIDHLLRANLREAMAENFAGTPEELDAAVDEVIAFAKEQGRKLRARAHWFKTDIAWSGSGASGDPRVMLSWDVERCSCDRPWRHPYPA